MKIDTPIRSPGTPKPPICPAVVQSVLKEAFEQKGKVYEMEERLLAVVEDDRE